MADFYYEEYVHNYEIDFFNYGIKEEIDFFEKNNIEVGCYYKNRNEWNKRISGMLYNITHLNYYPKLKEYLDYRFNIFTRKEKLKKLDEIK